MIKLIRNADVYAPAHLGKKDVLVIADKVVRIADKIEGYEGMPEVEVFDFSGKKLLPGYCYTGFIIALFYGYTGIGIAKLEDEKK